MMKTNILILSLLCSGLNAGAQQAYLSREEYRDKVEAYSQILKQQHLKTFASTEARKIASTGFLPQIDITAEGTANLYLPMYPDSSWKNHEWEVHNLFPSVSYAILQTSMYCPDSCPM